MHLLRTGLPLIAVAWLGAVALADPAEVGQPGPVLVVTQLDGNAFDLAAHRGEVVVLNLWATWCTPCRKEMPMLDALYRRHRASGLVLLGLSVDDAGSRAEVARVMRSFAYPGALLVESERNTLRRPEGVPITYVIGRDGVIRARLMPRHGGLTEDELSRVVLPLLATPIEAP